MRKNQRINLYTLYDELKKGHTVKYEPESPFGALRLRIDGLGINCFSNGSIVIAGLRSVNQEEQIITRLWLEYFRKHLV